MKPYILGAIFARGGSNGLPGKNIRNLAGKPLIAYAIETGLAISSIDKVIVSTDDEQIANVAKEYGAQVPFMRPKELATDNSPELLSWKHAILATQEKTGQRVDVLVSIPTTSPLRINEDVQNCISKLIESSADIVITVKETERNPYFNMVTIDKESNVQMLMKTQSGIIRRQDAPVVYGVTTVAYAAKASYILKASLLLEGEVKAQVIPQERALDIDTILDFEIAEFLMTKRRRIR